MKQQSQQSQSKPKLAKILDFATLVACAIGILLLIFKK